MVNWSIVDQQTSAIILWILTWNQQQTGVACQSSCLVQSFYTTLVVMIYLEIICRRYFMTGKFKLYLIDSHLDMTLYQQIGLHCYTIQGQQCRLAYIVYRLACRHDFVKKSADSDFVTLRVMQVCRLGLFHMFLKCVQNIVHYSYQLSAYEVKGSFRDPQPHASLHSPKKVRFYISESLQVHICLCAK